MPGAIRKGSIDMFCSKCGTQLPDSSRFCIKCGASVAPVSPNPVQPVQPVRTSLSFFETVKRNMNNSKIAILILNGIMLLSMFVVPYFYIVVGKSSQTSYPIRLIGGNDYPSSCPFNDTSDIGWTFLLFALIGAIACIVYSLLVNKYKFCKIASIANLGLSVIGFYSFFIPMTNSTDKYKNTSIAPIGAFIHIGLSIAILVLVIKLIKKEKQSMQPGPVIFR